MFTPYKDLEFSLIQTLLLIRIRVFGISKKIVRTERSYHFLLEYSLIDHSHKNPEKFVLSEKARMYLRYKRRQRIRFWIPVIISILALFGGYDVYTNPLLERVLRISATLLKTISESLGAFF